MRKLVALAVLVLALSPVMALAALWTSYDSDSCTVTITPSGRTIFRVTVGGTVTMYDLSDHEPITLDVEGLAWSVEVERSSGWYVDLEGAATECQPTPTTEPPTTTAPPEETTTTILQACDEVECPGRNTTTTEPPQSTEPPPSTTSSGAVGTPPNSTDTPQPTTNGPHESGESLPATGSELVYLSLLGISMMLGGYGLLRKVRR